jgi:hypothetical protein
MAEVRTTVIEENYPAVRRINMGGMNSLLNSTIAQSFLTFFEDTLRTSKNTLK